MPAGAVKSHFTKKNYKEIVLFRGRLKNHWSETETLEQDFKSSLEN